jgi:hypothetical protein
MFRPYLYDFIEDKRMYEVTWVDDPNRTNTQHISIEVHSKSTTSNAGMMYKLTDFMKTGSVTARYKSSGICRQTRPFAQ